MKQMHYLLVGYPFSGKTVLSKKLHERFGFIRLNIDEIKYEKGFEGVDDADVPESAWKEIFKEIDQRLIVFLKEGATVLNENAWMKREWRDGKRKIADDLGVETKIIYLKTPVEVVRQRWQENRKTHERFDISETLFEDSIRLFEEPTENENIILYTLETDFDAWIQEHFVSED